jgi:hypothetical protein
MSHITQFIAGNPGPGSDINTLTGNTGGAVSPDASFNVNVVGDGTSINVVGNPATHTLTISSTGIMTVAYTEVTTTPYTVMATDEFLGVDTLSSSISIKLPNLPAVGRVYMIKDIFGNAATNNIIITTVGGITLIDGISSYTMNTNFSAVQLIFNGTFYSVF